MAKSKKVIKRYRPKGRWSANIETLTNQLINATSGTFFSTYDLMLNPVQTSNTVSQQYTVKNIEISYEIDISGNAVGLNEIEGLTSYIMYVPQGMTVTEIYPNSHPEYIMAYRFLGSPNFEGNSNAVGRNPLKIRTRLARRLQTGDKIILLVIGSNTGTNTYQLQYNGIVRWWTKAN